MIKKKRKRASTYELWDDVLKGKRDFIGGFGRKKRR